MVLGFSCPRWALILPLRFEAELSPRDSPTEPHWPAPAPSVPCSTRLALAAARWAHRIGTTIVGTSILRPNCLTSLLRNLRACDRLPRGIVRPGRWPRPSGRTLVYSQCPGGCPPARPPKAESSSAPNCTTVRAATAALGAAAWCVEWRVAPAAHCRQPAPTSFGHAIVCTGMTSPAHRHIESGEAFIIGIHGRRVTTVELI